MGRIAGQSAQQTRERLLDGAGRVFARNGYDGTSITQIAEATGLSSGPIYTHYGSKAELFAATVRASCMREVDELLGAGDGEGVADRLAARGGRLDRRTTAESSLLVSAIVAAQTDPEIAGALVGPLTEREDRFAELIRQGQSSGEIDGGVAPAAAARFTLMLALGSLVAAAVDLPAVDHDDWCALIDGLVDRFRDKENA